MVRGPPFVGSPCCFSLLPSQQERLLFPFAALQTLASVNDSPLVALETETGSYEPAHPLKWQGAPSPSRLVPRVSILQTTLCLSAFNPKILLFLKSILLCFILCSFYSIQPGKQILVCEHLTATAAALGGFSFMERLIFAEDGGWFVWQISPGRERSTSHLYKAQAPARFP